MSLSMSITFCALGARMRKVTVPSADTSGETTFGPGANPGGWPMDAEGRTNAARATAIRAYEDFIIPAPFSAAKSTTVRTIVCSHSFDCLRDLRFEGPRTDGQSASVPGHQQGPCVIALFFGALNNLRAEVLVDSRFPAANPHVLSISIA